LLFEQTWNVTWPVCVLSGAEKVAVSIGVVEFTRTVSAGETSAGIVGVDVTLTAAPVFAVLEPSVTSVAVTVREPVVRRVTANVLVPPTSAALAGRLAWSSEDVMATVSVAPTGPPSCRLH
jgi:hypothetical protein